MLIIISLDDFEKEESIWYIADPFFPIKFEKVVFVEFKLEDYIKKAIPLSKGLYPLSITESCIVIKEFEV